MPTSSTKNSSAADRLKAVETNDFYDSFYLVCPDCNAFKSAEKINEESPYLDADPSGNSIVYTIWFNFPSGDLGFINCYDWSEEKNYPDHLRVGLMTKEFNDWLVLSD